MIKKLVSTLPTFKSLEFHEGLNIILVDKAPGATMLQTRNRAGKSSFVELVNFVTGGSAEDGTLFKTPLLSEHYFGMEFDLNGVSITAQRSGNDPGQINLLGDTSRWPLRTLETETQFRAISTNHWKLLLGHFMFGLPFEATKEKFKPTFRMLFPYFARRQADGGIMQPSENSKDQQTWGQQVSLTYMLNLDWSIAREWQLIREREKKVKELKSAAKGGAFGEILPSAADLRTKVVLVEKEASAMRQRLNDFKILDDYDSLAKEADFLSRKINEITDENTIDFHTIKDLETAIDSELPPPITNLEKLYNEAGVTLPDLVIRRFEDVRKFHQSVIQNRKHYLEQELEVARARLEERRVAQIKMDGRRRQLMQILQTHGALGQYTEMHMELSRLESRTQFMREKLETAEAIEDQNTKLKGERNNLLSRLQQDYKEQSETLKEAISLFGDVSKSLLDKAGTLTIKPDENGPEFLCPFGP